VGGIMNKESTRIFCNDTRCLYCLEGKCCADEVKLYLWVRFDERKALWCDTFVYRDEIKLTEIPQPIVSEWEELEVTYL
jgi:hypothetical protein